MVHAMVGSMAYSGWLFSGDYLYCGKLNFNINKVIRISKA